MNIDQVHTPQRLQDEPFAEYKSRRRMSKRLVERMTLLWNSKTQGTYFRPETKSAQRRARQVAPK